MDTMDRSGSGLTEITSKTDSRDILAHARRQADARNFDDVFIVDVDAHVDDGGNWARITEFIEDEVVREAANAFGDGSRKGAFLNGAGGLQWQNVWGRILHGRDRITLPDGSTTAAEIAMARASMSQMAMDYQVIFPRALLFLGMHPVPEMEIHLATAYNRWLVECALPQDPRVKAMLYLPFNSPGESEKMIERFRGAPGVAGFLVTSSRHKPVHANEYMRAYAMLEEAGLPIGFHAHHNWHDEYTCQLNRFLSMHAISFMLCNLVHLTNWVINGLPERFPKLKTVWIESGIAWLAFAMQRLDNEYLMRSSEAPLLKRMPSEYISEMFFTTQPMERTNMKLLEATFEAMKAPSQLLYASDWPHWDFDLPATVWDLPFLDDTAKRNILGFNAARVFNLEVPAKYRQQKQAAE